MVSRAARASTARLSSELDRIVPADRQEAPRESRAAHQDEGVVEIERQPACQLSHEIELLGAQQLGGHRLALGAVGG